MFVNAATLAAQTPATTSANAGKPPAASGTIQAGTYDIDLAFGGGVMKGTLEIKTIGDSIAAKIAVGDHNPPPIRKITRNGSPLSITAGDAGTNIVYDIAFDGDAVNGKFTFNGDPGLVTGKRRK